MEPEDKVRIRKNYTTLIEDLQVEYFVLDYLFQQGILTLDDKERIMAEVTHQDQAKKLLDMLVRSDSPSAYTEFCVALKQDYDYLLERLQNTEVSEQDIITYTANFVNQNEVFKAVRAELSQHYVEMFTRPDPIPWNEDMNITLPNVYTELKIMNKNTYDRYLTGPLDLNDIFTTLPLPGSTRVPKTVMIDGVAGMGKTTLCYKMAYDWTDPNTKNSVRKFGLVLMAELQHILTTDASFEDSLYDILFPADFKYSKEDVIQCIHENEQDILLILDGFTESNPTVQSQVLKILQGKLLHKISVMITARPSKLHAKYFDLRVRCKGFTIENAKRFITQFFRHKPVGFSVRLIVQIVQHPYLEQLVQNPFNTLLLCLLWEDHHGSLPRSLTQLFRVIIQVIVRKICYDKYQGDLVDNGEISEENIEACEKLMDQIQELAFEGLVNSRSEFTQKELEAKIADRTLHLTGFLVKSSSKTNLALENGSQYSFIHKNIQEILAALHVPKLSEELRSFHFRQFLEQRHTRILCAFIIGVLKDDHEKLKPLFEILAELNANSIQDENILVAKIESQTLFSSEKTVVEYVYNKTTRLSAVAFHCLNEVDNPKEFVKIIAESMPQNLFLDLKSIENHYALHHGDSSCFVVLEHMPCPKSVMFLELSYFSEPNESECSARNLFNALSHISKFSADKYELVVYCDGLNYLGFASIPFILDIFANMNANGEGCEKQYLQRKVKSISFLIHGCTLLRTMTDEEIATEMKLKSKYAHTLPPITLYRNRLACPHSPSNPEGILRPSNKQCCGSGEDVIVMETEGEMAARTFKELNPLVKIDVKRADIPADFIQDIY